MSNTVPSPETCSQETMSVQVKLTIDGTPVSVAAGSTILQAAQTAGIHVPTLCYLKERSAISSCRVCVVDVEGLDTPVPACSTRVAEGMCVNTSTERVKSYRKVAMDLILSDH